MNSFVHAAADEPTMDPFVHAAALWLARNNWKDSPSHWAEQAQIRYGLSDTETALLLLNMRIQLGHN